MSSSDEHVAVDEFLIGLQKPDPFAPVREASEQHRVEHAAVLAAPGEQTCGVYPSDPLKARLLGTLAAALQPRRILEIGGGLGYSALWLVTGAPPGARVDTIDRFPEHVALIGRHAAKFGLSDRISPLEGEADDILTSLVGPYDFIHDDGWFGEHPAYLERMLDLLQPSGTLAISNWFLIEQAIVAEPNMDWAQFAGPNWREDIRAYAEVLTARSDIDISFISRPWIAIAVKRQ